MSQTAAVKQARAKLDSQTQPESGVRVGPPRCSVVMPILNESPGLGPAMAALKAAIPAGWELILVDGGSTDDSRDISAAAGVRCLQAQPGRARQMNEGAREATGDYLLFLHADTRLGQRCVESLNLAMEEGLSWGWFSLKFDHPAAAFKLIAAAMSLRARLSRVCTGDQSLWIRRDLFQSEGGFADIPLMEDVELSKRLRARAAPHVLPGPVCTSARRWLQHGTVKTVLLMWRLRLRYWLGVSPERLAREYYGDSKPMGSDTGLT